MKIAQLSKQIHILAKDSKSYAKEEQELDEEVRELFLSHRKS